MRRLSVFVLLVAILACSEPPRPVSEPGEKLYTVRGTILSRRASDNTVFMDHEEIKGFMAAMKMDYAVRGAKVDELPPDGARVEAQLHVTQKAFWISDVKRMP